MSWKTTCVMVLGAAAWTVGAIDEARADEPAPGAATPAPAPAPAPAAAAAPAAAPAKDDATPDHDKFVGHFGVGYMGLTQLPFAGGQPGALTSRTVGAPVIGARYWIQRNLGLDLGIGFASITGSREDVGATQTITTDHESQLGFAFHVGVPIAFAHGKHYSFLLTPETNLGFTSGTRKGITNNPDTNYSGFLWAIGARVGAEIHFGFIGVPELSLEGGVGLYFRREAVKAKQDPNSSSDGTNTFGTAVPLTNPWGLFANQVNAIYYF